SYLRRPAFSLASVGTTMAKLSLFRSILEPLLSVTLSSCMLTNCQYHPAMGFRGKTSLRYGAIAAFTAVLIGIGLVAAVPASAAITSGPPSSITAAHLRLPAGDTQRTGYLTVEAKIAANDPITQFRVWSPRQFFDDGDPRGPGSWIATPSVTFAS